MPSDICRLLTQPLLTWPLPFTRLYCTELLKIKKWRSSWEHPSHLWPKATDLLMGILVNLWRAQSRFWLQTTLYWGPLSDHYRVLNAVDGKELFECLNNNSGCFIAKFISFKPPGVLVYDNEVDFPFQHPSVTDPVESLSPPGFLKNRHWVGQFLTGSVL